MNVRIEQKDSFVIIGIKHRFLNVDGLGDNIGQMWEDISAETIEQISALGDELVGVYCGMYKESATDYYIASITDKDCPEQMHKLEIPSHTWAIFEIIGPMPTAMTKVWGRIFSDWLPTSDYDHADAPDVEWYPKGDYYAADYKSEIWIPLIKKRSLIGNQIINS